MSLIPGDKLRPVWRNYKPTLNHGFVQRRPQVWQNCQHPFVILKCGTGLEVYHLTFFIYMSGDKTKLPGKGNRIRAQGSTLFHISRGLNVRIKGLGLSLWPCSRLDQFDCSGADYEFLKIVPTFGGKYYFIFFLNVLHAVTKVERQQKQRLQEVLHRRQIILSFTKHKILMLVWDL